jgi:nitroimidazol reductase NimA-like FMN-containing flavoprotein (pyridoxamine 5'-phosphate oxidase superfamily)
MESKETLLAQIKTLLGAQLFGVLATQGADYPYCSLVGYAVSEDAKSIYFPTIRETQKFRNLFASPRVSLLVNNQTNQANDLLEAHALTVLGTATEVAPEFKEEARTLYLQKHPSLKEFVTTPNCVMVKIQVTKYIFVTDFQHVDEYTIG